MAGVPRLKEQGRQLVSPSCLFRDLEELTGGLRATLHRIDDTWRRRDVASNDDDPSTSDDDDPPTSPSRALATYKSSPLSLWSLVTVVASDWRDSWDGLMHSYDQLARKVAKFWLTKRGLFHDEADGASAATARASGVKEQLARYKMTRGNRVELGQALGREKGAEVMSEHEARVRGHARVAASEATAATMVRQRLEEALGLLERLVAACDKAPAITRELRCLHRDIKDALGRAHEAYPDVPEDLVAKVAEAKRLWEANARLVEDHLLGTLQDNKFRCDGAPEGPSACGVAERCLRATEDIPRLLRAPECPQSVPRVSPVSMEPQELSLLQVLVAVVATLGEVVATVTEPHRAKCLRESPVSLHEDLKDFTRSLCKILEHGGVPSLGHCGVPSLGRALAALGATPGTTRANVRAVASAWLESVAELVDSWDQLAREATKLRDTCGTVVTDQQLMVALDKEEVAREMAMPDAQGAATTSEAVGEVLVSTRLGLVATRRGHWAEVALGLLQCLVATCDKATLFNWNMECQLRDIKAILKGRNEVSPDALQALVAKVAEFERLWEASARLAKDHLLGALGDIDNILLSPCAGGPGDPGSREVAQRGQKSTEDITRMLWGQ